MGQGRIAVSADVVILRHVQTVLNPVLLANLNRLQPIATARLETNFGVSTVFVTRGSVSVSHVAIGKCRKELAKPNLWILAILAKPINISFS